ncbi:hypothetical protein SRHO_G00283510 [Serrasalmus rhombeus]
MSHRQGALQKLRLWSPWLPDVTPSDFFLWDMLYRNEPRTVEGLKETIQCETAASPPMLVDMFRNMEPRVEMCLAENGDQVKVDVKQPQQTTQPM